MNNEPDGAAGLTPAVPSYLTRFVGRDSELALVSERLSDPEVRWISLTGPGGVGKTRLAIEAVHRAGEVHGEDEAPPEAVFVPLFGVFDIDQAIDVIARRLDPSANDTDPIAVIHAACRLRRLIIVLDNADGLVSNGARLLSLLEMSDCGGVAFLVTSRTPFNVTGEHLLTLQPLEIPTDPKTRVEDLRSSPAITLFLDRARAARLDVAFGDADLPAIAEICHKVDGLPLAIELSANKIRQLSLPAIMAQLEESRFSVDTATAPHTLPGHVGLHDSIASSFDLLTSDQQTFLMRLSVFTGGISLESAKRMAAGFDPADGYPIMKGYDLETGYEVFTGDIGVTEAPKLRARNIALSSLDLDVPVTLELLADRSLLQRTIGVGDSPRFQFLETINEFVSLKLVDSGSFDAVCNAQMVAMLALSEAVCEGVWTGHRRILSSAHLDIELPNIRRSIDWLIDQGEDASDLAIRMSDWLLVYWQMRGQFADGMRYLERALSLPGEHQIRRINGLGQLGFANWMTGDFEKAESLLNEALHLVRGTTYYGMEGRLHFYLALVEWRKGPEHAPVAFGYIQTAMELFAKWNDGIGLGVCKLALGEVGRAQGDLATALHLFNESLDHFEDARYEWGIATAKWFIGEAERASGNERRSAEFLAAGLVDYRATGDRLGMAGCVAGIACLLAAREEWALSARLFGAALALRERTQSRLPPTHESDHETVATLVVQTIGTEDFIAGRSGDHTVIVEDAHRIARAIATGNPIDPAPQLRVKRLSQSRREVLLLLGEGHEVKSIAQRLDRSLSTVYHHIDGLIDDLGVSSRDELRARARLITSPKPAPGQGPFAPPHRGAE